MTFVLTPKARTLVYQFEGLSLRCEWPGGASGITAPLGYDFGYHSRFEITHDWGAWLKPGDLARLLNVSGVKGEGARDLLPNVADIRFSEDAAHEVFEVLQVPRYAELMTNSFPGVSELPADAQGAMWSLCFNRGVGFTDKHPELHERSEMRAIRDAILAWYMPGRPNGPGQVPTLDATLGSIAAQLRSMKRLWDEHADAAHQSRGLVRRREAEAALVESCIQWQPIGRCVITVDILNVRTSPSLEAPAIGTAKRGEMYPLLETSGDWSRIALVGGGSGWIAKRYTQETV
jgi:GH24 family phage-related lysozyme (muramidase)